MFLLPPKRVVLLLIMLLFISTGCKKNNNSKCTDGETKETSGNSTQKKPSGRHYQFVAFSKDSKKLFSIDSAGIMFAWDIESKKILYVKNQGKRYEEMCVGPLGKQVALTNKMSHTVELLCVDNGNLIHLLGKKFSAPNLNDTHVESNTIKIKYSPNGKHIAVVKDDLRIYSTETGQIEKIIPCVNSKFEDVLAYIGSHPNTKLSSEERLVIASTYFGINALDISPESKRIAIGGTTILLGDQLIRSLKTGNIDVILENKRESWQKNSDALLRFTRTAIIQFSSNGKYILTSGFPSQRNRKFLYDISLKVWDIQSGQLLFNKKGYTDPCGIQHPVYAQFSPDGKHIVCAYGPCIDILKSKTGYRILKLEDDMIWRYLFSKKDISIDELYNSPSGRTLLPKYTQIGYSLNGKWIYALDSGSGHVSIYDSEKGILLTKLKLENNHIVEVAVSPDSKYICTLFSKADEVKTNIALWNTHNWHMTIIPADTTQPGI